MENTTEPKRQSFVFYWSFKDALNELDNYEDKYRVYEAISDFAFGGVDPQDLNAVCRMAWKLIKPQLIAYMERYDRCVENGKKGGTPRGNKNARKNNLNDNDNVNVNL